jgi:uncharacterized membrane protein
MPQLARQQIAGLFFALSILLFLDKGMTVVKRAALLIIFGFSIVVSHYGLSYFYMFYLLFSLFLLSSSQSRALRSLWSGLPARFGKAGGGVRIPDGERNPRQPTGSTSTLSTTFVISVVIFGLAWYMYTAYGSAFNAIVHIGNHLYHSLGDLFVAEARDPAVLLAIGLGEVASVQRFIFLVIQYITQLFIIVGVIGLVFNLQKTRFQPVYIAMTLVTTVLIAMSIVLPYFAGFFWCMQRIYHTTLLFLAPFCILGGITVFQWLFRQVPARPFRTSTDVPANFQR